MRPSRKGQVAGCVDTGAFFSKDAYCKHIYTYIYIHIYTYIFNYIYVHSILERYMQYIDIYIYIYIDAHNKYTHFRTRTRTHYIYIHIDMHVFAIFSKCVMPRLFRSSQFFVE